MELSKIQKTVLGFVGGFIIGALIIWGWSVFHNRPRLDVPAQTTAPTDVSTDETASADAATDTTKEITNTDTTQLTESAHIVVTDQAAGATVHVDELSLALDGWAVVHEEQGGYIGNALGAMRRDAGSYTDLTVSLLRNTEPATRYWVVLYSDNGDRLFNLHDDFPIRDANSNPIISSFMTNK